MTADIHTCSYYCERPECIRAQRDELAARMAVTVTPEEIAAMVRKGVEAERERCARVCESLGGNGPGYIDDDWARMCADAIRDGRAPQPETQCGEELPSPLNGDFDCPKAAAARSCPCGFCRAMRAPSAPVGVELSALRVQEWLHREHDILCPVQEIEQAMRTPCSCPFTERALAQQPAAGVGEEIMVNAAHGVFTLLLQPSGLSSGPRFVVHVPAPEQKPASPRGAVNVVGMPEFDDLMDHIYEYGTTAEGVVERANAFARAVLAQYAPQQPAAGDGDFINRIADSLIEKGWDIDPNCDGTGVAQLRGAVISALAAQHQEPES